MLFETLVKIHMRQTNEPVTITTGIAFGHKILTIGDFKFIEIDENCVAVEGHQFNMRCINWEQLEFIYKAVR